MHEFLRGEFCTNSGVEIPRNTSRISSKLFLNESGLNWAGIGLKMTSKSPKILNGSNFSWTGLFFCFVDQVLLIVESSLVKLDLNQPKSNFKWSSVDVGLVRLDPHLNPNYLLSLALAIALIAEMRVEGDSIWIRNSALLWKERGVVQKLLDLAE